MTDRQPFKRLHYSFSWKKVPDALVKAMVVARYKQLGKPEDARRVRKAGASTARSNVRRAFRSASKGSAPTDKQLDGEVFDVLLTKWIGQLGKAKLWEIIEALPRDVRRPPQDSDLASLRKFVRRHGEHPQVRKAIKKLFRSAHRVQDDVTVNPGSPKQAPGPLTLQGRAHPQRNPWHEHQSAARARLDELYDKGNFAGRLILPTGAGKTSTAAGWLLDRMSEDPSLRVMWLVHMQSLADQAITTFVDLAEEQETSFTRRARIIHSKASARSTLADPDTNLVALTYQ